MEITFYLHLMSMDICPIYFVHSSITKSYCEPEYNNQSNNATIFFQLYLDQLVVKDLIAVAFPTQDAIMTNASAILATKKMMLLVMVSQCFR